MNPHIPLLWLLQTAILILLPTHSAFAQRVRGEIKNSEFDRKLKETREAAFSRWMDSKEASSVYRSNDLEGNLLIAVERNSSGQVRMIHFTPSDGKGGDIQYESSLSEQEILERHPLWEKQGYNILFLGENPSGATHSAIWIETDVYGEAVKRLTDLGVSPATIVITSTPSRPASSPSRAPISVPVRDWKNNQGQNIRASVEDIENGEVKFVLADGRKVAYPLSNLGQEEQRFLNGLLAAPPATPSSSDASGFSDWMEYAEYEKLYAEERGKGRYAIYVETNPRDEYRAIFDDRPENLGWYYGFGKSEASLRESDVSYRGRGLSILSLSYNRRSERYCALWVADRVMEKAKAQLSKHGITAASIDDEIKISIVSKD